MKTYFRAVTYCTLLFFTWLQASTLEAQIPFKIREYENTVTGSRIDSITRKQFDFAKIKPYRKHKINSDSLLKAVRLAYPNAIQVTDSCCRLLTAEKSITVCNNRGAADPREWTSYRAWAYKRGYLILERGEYEDVQYILFNPSTRKSFSLPATPEFIDNTSVYAAAASYGDGYFLFVDIKAGKYISFITDRWEPREYYASGNYIYLHFVSAWNKDKFLRIRHKLQP